MSDVTLSKAVRANLLNLQKTATQLGITQERLASGLRVNSALDNPTNFFTAASLNSRSADMNALLDAMSNGIQTIEAADNGLTAITKNLESMVSTLTQARQDKSFKAASYTISPSATGNISFSGGAVGSTPISVALGSGTTSPTAGTNDITFGSAMDFTATTATSGGVAASGSFSSKTFTDATSASLQTAFGSTLTFDDAGDQLNFSLNIDGSGVVNYTIDSSAITAAGLGGNTISNSTELATVMNYVVNTEGTYTTGAGNDLTIDGSGGNITISSLSTGTGSTVSLSGVGVVENGGANTLTNTSGLADNTDTGVAGDVLRIDLDVDGVNQVLTFNASEVNAELGSLTIGSLSDLATVINSKLSGASADGSGTNLVLTSDSTGASSNVDVNGVTFDDDGGGAVADSFTGFAGGSVTAGTVGIAGTTPTLTFDVTVDGGTVQNITIDAAAVASATGGDSVIDDADELATVINSLTTGLTAINNAGTITLRSDTTGTNSSVSIANTTATGVTNTSGITDGSGTTGAATGGAALRTVDQLVNAINNDPNLKTAVRASIDNGKLRIENLSTSELTITGYNATSASIDGSSGTATIGGNTVRADLSAQYNTLIDQLDKFSDDASYNGVNLLRGDKLKITFNETSTSEIDIQTKDGNAINSANLGVRTSMTPADLDSDTAIENFIVDVKAALRSVRSQASAFGSNLSVVQNRQEFTKHMINTLETGASNLTLADTNEEAANLLALQTRQQLSSTALSLASQADQNVLRLF